MVATDARSSKLQAPSSKEELSFDPFSYSRRPTETIERDGVRLGGEELIRVVVRQANFDKVAHKIERLGITNRRSFMRRRGSRKWIRAMTAQLRR